MNLMHRFDLRPGPFRTLRRGAALFVAVVAAVAWAASASPASAMPAGLTAPAAVTGHRPHRAPQISPAIAAGTRQGHAISSGTLIYGGGPVQHASSVYLVFWGSQWNNDNNGVETYMQNLFSYLGSPNDSWSHITSQYTDSSGQGPIFNGSELHGTWVDNTSAAPTSASAAQISSEADRGAAHFGVSGPNVQIFVLSPSGTHPDGFPDTGFCAWHDYNGNVPYTNMPYILDAGSACDANPVNSQLDGFSLVSAHEYAEILTDPEPTSGYVASDGEEIADLCAWQPPTLPPGGFPLPPLWSNAADRCVSV